MSAKFLVEADIGGNNSIGSEGLTGNSIFYLDNLLVTAQPTNLDIVLVFLDQNFSSCNIAVNASSLQDIDDVIKILNQGASRVFVNHDIFKELTNVHGVDSRRLALALQDEDSALNLDHGGKELSVAIRGSFSDALVQKVAQSSSDGSESKTYAFLDSWNADTYARWIDKGIVPIVQASHLTNDHERFPGKAPLHTLLLQGLSTDRPDNLWPTIVLNERGDCLGLVYSSAASVAEAVRSGRGVYQSRKRQGLWIKGETSGDVQQLLNIRADCDGDTLVFTVKQGGNGFCHLKTDTCFGPYSGLTKLQRTLQDRRANAPPESYTARLYSNPKLLQAKILEEANELCDATTKDHVASEAADLIYFALTKCIASGVGLDDVERNLDLKSLRVSRRKGDAKPQFAQKVGLNESGRIRMQRYSTSETPSATLEEVLERPAQKASDEKLPIVKKILEAVRTRGDAAMLEYIHQLDKAPSVTLPVLRAPFPENMMQLKEETKSAIDVAFANIHKFHKSQEDKVGLTVETMEGVLCSRFSRPIERVGLYVPGGTAVLPSTALMLGVPAMIAGCKTVTIASPPRPDGTPTPEIVYIAHKVNADCILLAGGAQAVAGMAYGTDSIPKVEKIFGPGNQWVTLAKMLVSNDTRASVAIDMPAGPSEVLVIADKMAEPAFVAADLLSQAEHGPDSQVVLIAVGLDDSQLAAIEQELHDQAHALPRVDIVRGAIDHSVTLVVNSVEEAMEWSNKYAPEHLILQVDRAEEAVKLVTNAGSVFIGPWTPESVGDYAAGVNHSLPTAGYAKQYSGVNLASFTKHITSTKLSKTGLRNLSPAVSELARVEGLDAHRRAVEIRMKALDKA